MNLLHRKGITTLEFSPIDMYRLNPKVCNSRSILSPCFINSYKQNSPQVFLIISTKQPVSIEILLHNIHIKCLELEVPGSFTKIGTNITTVYSLTTYQAAALMCVVRSTTIRSRGRARWRHLCFLGSWQFF